MRTRRQVRSFGQDITNIQQSNFLPSSSAVEVQKQEIAFCSHPSRHVRASLAPRNKVMSEETCITQRVEQIMKFSNGYYGQILHGHTYISSGSQFHQQQGHHCKAQLFSTSPQLTLAMRNILVEWLIEVHNKMGLRYETLYLTIFLVDKFCSKREVAKSQYQLLAMACLFVAGKYEEVATPKLKKIINLCDRLYDSSDVLKMESQLLLELNFKISQPSLNWFISFQLFVVTSSQEDENNQITNSSIEKFKRMSYYITQLCLFQFEVLRKYSPQVISNTILLTISMDSQFINIDVKESTKYLSSLEKKAIRDCTAYVRKVYKDRLNPKYEAVNHKYPDMAVPDEIQPF